MYTGEVILIYVMKQVMLDKTLYYQMPNKKRSFKVFWDIEWLNKR
jgi:hypothetical protein